MFNAMTLRHSELLNNQTALIHGFYGRPKQVRLDTEPAANYIAQLETVATQISVPMKRMIEVEQVHSVKVRLVGAPWATEPPKADAMVTDQPGLALVLKTADCAPVLLIDPQAGVIGAAHAGWHGALAGILQQTVLHMGFLGAKPERIVASIGPCISVNSYEVGLDFEQTFVDKDQENSRFFIHTTGAKPHFDLGTYCQQQLDRSGIFATHLMQIDTFDEKNNFFSYRRACKAGESGYGRNISMICLGRDSGETP